MSQGISQWENKAGFNTLLEQAWSVKKTYIIRLLKNNTVFAYDGAILSFRGYEINSQIIFKKYIPKIERIEE